MTVTHFDPKASEDIYLHLRKTLLRSLKHSSQKNEEGGEIDEHEIRLCLDEIEGINDGCPLILAILCTIKQLLGLSSTQLPNSIQVYQDHLLSWGELLYPKQSCELVALLIICQKSREEAAAHSTIKDLSAALLNTLDSDGEPIFSLFSQLDRSDLNECRAAYMLFFAAMSRVVSAEKKGFYQCLALKQKKCLEQASNDSFFIEYTEEILSAFFELDLSSDLSLNPLLYLPSTIIDKHLSIAAIRKPGLTQLFIGKGCKSGMGYFKFNDVGIVNYGPQLHSIGNASYFGVSGKSETNKFFRPYIESTAKALSLDSHQLISSQGFESGVVEFEENGFSGLWLNAKQRGDEKGWSLSSVCEGMLSATLYFVFYLKTPSCIINRSQKVRPRSLDRYQGPPLEIECRGEEGGFTIQTLQGSKSMEVIPLADDNSFWGADFLVAYRFNLPLQAPFISATHQWKIQLLNL